MKEQDCDDENSESSGDAPATPKLEKTGVWAEPAAKVKPDVEYSWRARKAPEPSPCRTDDRTSLVSYSEYEYSESDEYTYGNSGDEEPDTQVPLNAKPYKAPVVKVPLLPQTAKAGPTAPPKRASPPKMSPPPQRASWGSKALLEDMMPPAIKHRRDRSKAPARPRAPSSPREPGATSKSVPSKKKHRNDTPCTQNSKGTGVQHMTLRR